MKKIYMVAHPDLVSIHQVNLSKFLPNRILVLPMVVAKLDGVAPIGLPEPQTIETEAMV